MRNALYPYDGELYSRLFLNCYQRQSLVMLAERVPHIPLLFHSCLISTDEILRQVVRERRPKYDFASGLLAPENLARIGVTAEEESFGSYAEARSFVRDIVHREGYAILVGDVYYWPHCPEYRTRHLTHTIVLTGYDADTARWRILDDNPASVLCRYTYPEQVIADSYDHGEVRRIRYFTIREADAEAAEHGARRAFAELLETYEDSHRLLTAVADIVSCPWTAPEHAIASLHDAFGLYQGSRTALLAYTRRTAGDPAAEDGLGRIVRQAAGVHGQLLLGKVTGTVDLDRLTAVCRELRDAEEELVRRLKAVTAARGRV
ncbi:BtrH N-terminal domain-containing protein [Streptomyces sp. NPDC052020]|uniref:BtrH N-terminal domain-containing protein n=1 Tax=Streptomyces sp. NPDC052020 TaxID=3155677 RepID=UPI0034291E7F